MDDTDAPPASAELAELQRDLAAVRAENEALVKKLGPRAAAVRNPALLQPADLTPSTSAPSGGYREPDRDALTSRALVELRSVLAAERIDNEVLRSMQERDGPVRVRLPTPVKAGLGVLGATFGVGLLVFALKMGYIGALLVLLAIGLLFFGIDRLPSSIPPRGDGRPGGAPRLPPPPGM